MNDFVALAHLLSPPLVSVLVVLGGYYTWTVDRRLIALASRLDALFTILERLNR